MAVRWVLHVDLDQFIAAVEVLRRPELQGRAVVVGGRGDPMERSVVTTASYEARRFGVGSRMPLRIAARKCPDAVFLPVDAPAYQAVSAQVMETLRSGPAVVEVLGWDEAFLGVDTDDPELFAREVQQAILAREPGCTAPSESATTSCARRSPPGSPSRPGSSSSPRAAGTP